MKLLSAQTAFAALKELNEKGEFEFAFFFDQKRYDNLRQENCFGLQFPGGARLLGESSGTRKYTNINWAEGIAVGIGFLCADSSFSVGDKRMEEGCYLLLATPDMVQLFTRRPFIDRFGQKTREIITENFVLGEKLDAHLLTKESAGRPRFSLVVQNEEAFLRVGANNLKIKSP